jgi:hypothetical protein
MKLVMLVYNQVVSQEILETLEGLSGAGYTIFSNITGKGSSGYRLGSVVWPAKNRMALVMLPESEVAQLKDGVKELKARSPDLGIKAFILPCQEVW